MERFKLVCVKCGSDDIITKDEGSTSYYVCNECKTQEKYRWRQQ